jgi:hypothetical protein
MQMIWTLMELASSHFICSDYLLVICVLVFTKVLQSMVLTYCSYPAWYFQSVSMYFGVSCFFLFFNIFLCIFLTDFGPSLFCSLICVCLSFYLVGGPRRRCCQCPRLRSWAAAVGHLRLMRGGWPCWLWLQLPRRRRGHRSATAVAVTFSLSCTLSGEILGFLLPFPCALWYHGYPKCHDDSVLGLVRCSSYLA